MRAINRDNIVIVGKLEDDYFPENWTIKMQRHKKRKLVHACKHSGLLCVCGVKARKSGSMIHASYF